MTISRDFVLNNLYIGLQKTSTEPIAKKNSDFDGIEEYLYLRHDGMEQKINSDVLKAAGIMPEEAWEKADENTNHDTKIMSLSEAICGIDDGNPLYVVTNQSGHNGAANIFDKNALAMLSTMFGTHRLAVLPSSIHEMLVLPADMLPFKELCRMVGEVNATEVEENERLTDTAYILSVA